jgi:hypothetical protein
LAALDTFVGVAVTVLASNYKKSQEKEKIDG